MIPVHEPLGDFARERLPGQTFFYDERSGALRGMADGWQATKQAAWLILNTERYLHLIYSFDYGAEVADLSGRSEEFVFPEIKRRVTEALLVDDRITGTSDFVFEHRKNRVGVRFTVHTIYGDMQMEQEIGR